MAKNAMTFIPSPNATVDGFAEVSCPWPMVDDHLRATSRTMRELERSELVLAGTAKAEHVEDALRADGKPAFRDAAETVASRYERALVEAGTLLQPERTHSLHLLELDDGCNPARGIVLAVILCVPFWVIAGLIAHRLL